MQFVITSMPVGGAETLLVNLLRRMDRNVVCPEVICLKEPGPLGEAIADEFPVHSHLIGGKYDVCVLSRLVRLMRRRQSDVVITVGAGDKMFWGRLAAFLAGVPVIASALHSTGWPDGVGRLNRTLTPLTDAFIAVAQSHGEFLHRFEGFPQDKVHVIRNGVDCERFKPNEVHRREVREELKLDPDAQLVGIVAALRSEKNHSLLVRAAARLRDRHPQLHWLIVGDGPERDGIERLAEELQVADRIHLLGTRHDTPRLLSALDVFTLCSLNEASPVSILEALACEVPVVASDVGSVGETVIDDRTGRLFASEDLDAMSQAIEQLLGDPASRRRMGQAGRDLVLRTGSLESMVAGYQNLATSLYDQACPQQSAVAKQTPVSIR
ncbi:glycosyl transferase family 1 [Rhodopirellula sp. SM50]|nr:glycosyltransferase [Rhodopirellula sp. SM50]PAY17283.1 glycosyl transferase family 1 [Rhodopirellula sp. SM50]